MSNDSYEYVIEAQPGPQWQFVTSKADIAIYGGQAGGGKSYGLLLIPLRYLDLPQFRTVILRRTFTEILKPGGLWEDAEELYQHCNATARRSMLRWQFPSGAYVEFSHLQHEADKYRYQGSQIPAIFFDELTHFTQSQFWYLLSRNRSGVGVRPFIRATCNPDADSWVAPLIRWWLDEEGRYADPAKSGVLRWFVRQPNNQLLWADDPDELRERVPNREPKSLTFIPATLEDNPALLRKDPGYLANLDALDAVERARLRGGDWRVRASEGVEWPDELWDSIWPDYWPDRFDVSVIAIDPSRGKNPAKGDYSAVVFLGAAHGLLWVDAHIARVPLSGIVRNVWDLYERYQPQAIGIEAAANQELLLGAELQRYAEAQGQPPLPLWDISPDGPKASRIFRLNPYVTQRALRFRPGSPGCKLLEDQLRGFPLPNVHDDGPDALEQAERLLTALMTQGGRGVTPGQVVV